jgi:hypothetical protein
VRRAQTRRSFIAAYNVWSPSGGRPYVPVLSRRGLGECLCGGWDGLWRRMVGLEPVDGALTRGVVAGCGCLADPLGLRVAQHRYLFLAMPSAGG